MGGLTSPKGGDTRTTTQVNQVPGYVSAAQQNLYQSGQNIASPFLQAPSYTTAGINADQSGAYDLTRYLAQGAFTGANTNVPAVSSLSPVAAFAPAQGAGNASMATAAQVGPNDFQQFMNPYTQAVIDPAVANLRRQSDINAAQIGAQSAAAGSYGGSREALRQAQNTRATGEQVASTVAQLMSQGYTQAQALAQANAQMQQQANLTNASAANNMAQFNTNAYNTNQQFNASAQNAWNNTLAQYGLSSAQMQDALKSSDQTRKLQAISALLGIGNSQQQLAQANLNTPLTYLQALAGITPQNTGGTQTTVAPNTAQSPLQTLLGIGASLGGAALRGGL